MTIALISIPFAGAIAMAMGGTAMMGLCSEMYGTAVQGILGGSNYNVIGPAGALVNIVSTYSAVHGIKIIPWISMLSGVLSFFIYKFGLESYCTMLPMCILEGF